MKMVWEARGRRYANTLDERPVSFGNIWRDLAARSRDVQGVGGGGGGGG